MKKQYKIQLPKGKKVTLTNVDFKSGVMIVDAELENDFHNVMHDEVCGVFSRINNHCKEVLKANGATRENIEEMAKESIKELEKDCPDIWDKMIQEYGEAICGKKVQKYEPKDGDFVYVKAGYEHIAIFKEKVGENMYVYANWDMSFSVSKIIIDDSRPLCCIHDLREIRPATEIEKKILIDQLAKVNKRWNEETKTIEDVRWRAKDGETFYYIDKELLIKSMVRCEFHSFWKKYDSLEDPLKDERFNNVEYMLWKKRNYFKTREAAEKVAEQIRNIFENSKSE